MFDGAIQLVKKWTAPGSDGQPPYVQSYQLVVLTALCLSLVPALWFRKELVWPITSVTLVAIGLTFGPTLRSISWVLRGLLIMFPLFLPVLFRAGEPVRALPNLFTLTGLLTGGLLLLPSHRKIAMLLNPKVLALMPPIDGTEAAIQVGFILCAVLGEELFFRAYLAPALAGSTGVPASAILNGLLFAGYHAVNRHARATFSSLDYVLQGVLGTLCAGAYLSGAPIFWPVGVHLAYNGPALLRPILIWLRSRRAAEWEE